MGMYVNPGNEGFARILANGSYVDKTGLIALVSAVVDTSDNMVCVTRPRRFGKTFAAESLVAYYSVGCDSRELFEGLEISRDPSFGQHLNAYNVVRLDMSAFSEKEDVAGAVTDRLIGELRREYSDVTLRTEAIDLAFNDVVDATGRRFVFVVDEWDAPLRERRSKRSQEGWIHLLRLLFKNLTFTSKVVAAAYMTGILPIVRYGTQSALSDFHEYTVLRPHSFAPYVGFTDEEVERLASRYDMDLTELRRWYDGYELSYVEKGVRSTVRAFAPYSVMVACQCGEVGPYWVESEAFRALLLYIDLDFDGLQQAMLQALGGACVPVRTTKFANDMHEVASVDDALTLLCHLGYLVFDPKTRTARVPNAEVAGELRDALFESRHAGVARIVRESDALLRAVWDADEQAVAAGLARAHDNGCAPQYYSDEQALRAVVRSALISAVDHYAEVQELPSGRGVADIVYLPRRGDPAPALVVELKWDRPVRAAIDQIRDRDYPHVLRTWGGPIMLVGVTYDPKSKEHVCEIAWA